MQSSGTATVAVADDGPTSSNGPPSISIADETASEGDGVMTVTVSLSKASTKWIWMGYKIENGTVVSQSDYNPSSRYALGSRSTILAAGQTSARISVSIVDDQEPKVKKGLQSS